MPYPKPFTCDVVFAALKIGSKNDIGGFPPASHPLYPHVASSLCWERPMTKTTSEVCLEVGETLAKKMLVRIPLADFKLLGVF